MNGRYLINEIFYSLQGEGVRAGTPNVFIRFAKCNLACNQAEHGFDCDTDFNRGDWYTPDEIVDTIGEHADPEADWVIFTGGEPSLQLDLPLIQLLRCVGWNLAIETNGTRPLPFGLDWVTVSPKPGTTVVVTEADEVKFVVAVGAELPTTTIKADHYLLSPAFQGDDMDAAALGWCIDLCLRNPPWRLSVQQHKLWGVR